MTIIHHVEIGRPVSDVWSYMNHTDNRQLWISGFLQYCPVKGKEGDIGSSARSVIMVNGREVELREELLETLPDERMKRKITNRVFDAVLELHLKGVEQLTIVSIHLQAEWKGARSVLLKMFWQPTIEKKMLESLHKLKEVLESENVYVNQ